jgi:hypothetical protein
LSATGFSLGVHSGSRNGNRPSIQERAVGTEQPFVTI